jgi:hypothetical protein
MSFRCSAVLDGQKIISFVTIINKQKQHYYDNDKYLFQYSSFPLFPLIVFCMSASTKIAHFLSLVLIG